MEWFRCWTYSNIKYMETYNGFVTTFTDFKMVSKNLLAGNGPLTRYVNCGLRMRRECRERFPRHCLQRKPRVSDPGMHTARAWPHVPWCMSGFLTCGGGENVPGIPGACATCNFTYLARGPWEPSSFSLRIHLTFNYIPALNFISNWYSNVSGISISNKKFC